MYQLGNPQEHFFVASRSDPGVCHYCKRPATAHPERPADPVKALTFFGEPRR